MKTINLKFNLYEYDELSDDAKAFAFDVQEEFLRNNPQEYEDDDGNIKYDDMDLLTEIEIKEYVEDNIHINEYLFFEDGKKANITKYTGGHQKAGKTELRILNQIIEVK